MQTDQIINQQLNIILANEIVAVSQFTLHARILNKWGLSKLNGEVFEQSVDEMNHAISIADRILFLEGTPNFQDMKPLNIGENIEEIFRNDLHLELDAVDALRSAIEVAEDARDYVTLDLLIGILKGEEKHINWLESQLSLMDRVGVNHYQQSMI